MFIDKIIEYQLSDKEREAIKTVRQILLAMHNQKIQLNDLVDDDYLQNLNEIDNFLAEIINKEGCEI